MEAFDLDTPLIDFKSASGVTPWRIRDAVESVLIFGNVGSGKSSGSGRLLALKYLTNGFGGLVLTAKPGEKELFEEYCRLAGRSEDLIVLEPGGGKYFNFLEYEATQTETNVPLTANIVQVLKTVIRAGEQKDKGKSDDQFWETALDMLISNVIDLTRLAYNRISVQEIFDIVQTIPASDETVTKEMVEKSEKPFFKAYNQARLNVMKSIDEWRQSLTPENRKLVGETDYLTHIPNARNFKMLDQFFMTGFKNLSDKTRSIIDFSLSGFLFRLLQEPVYSLFCKKHSNVTPEDSLKGRIIVLNLPVKTYQNVGRDCQILFKYVWQRAMEKRDVVSNPRPVFLWADEAQHFLHEHDTEFQATARSSRIATVYISQNLPNFFAVLGGAGGEYKVKALLGTMGTKIFHANADIETNNYASELIGDSYFEDISSGFSIAKEFSKTRNRGLILERQLRPEDFVSLKTGGPANHHVVEGIVHKQGDGFISKQNHARILFTQLYKPQ
jgi:type IV secretory pathway TraG/TraD family ATPase VirD4